MDLIRHPAYKTEERPFMIIWETTQACDLACRHCRAEAQPKHDPLALDTVEAKKLIDEVTGFGKPRPLLIFTGGDPFNRHDLVELVRYASNLGLPVGVSPSGTPLLTFENLQRIQDAGAKAISLSIDGSDSKRHDDFRRVAGSFHWTTAGWKAARELGLKVQINTTVSRYNLHDLPNIFKLVAERGALTWSLFFLVPMGRARQEDEITAAEYEAVMHFLYDASKYISAKPTEGHHFKRVVLQRSILESKGIPAEDFFNFHPAYLVLKHDLQAVVRAAGLVPKQTGMKRTPMHINSGNGFVFVSVRGEVFPSGFLPISGGNIRKDSLVDIYRNSALFRELRDTTKYEGRCGRCEFVPVCGGSRSRAYAISQDPLAEEPFCTYEPGSFLFQQELQELMCSQLPAKSDDHP